jgi:hypothetical protein
LARARRRYHELHPLARPPLTQPENAVGLFAAVELRDLAVAGYWPLPAEAVARMAVSPWELAHRRERRRARLYADLVALVRQYPDEMRQLLESLAPGRAS